MRFRICRIALPLLLAAVPGVAAATECAPSSRVSTCVDSDNLWVRPGPSQFMAVAGTKATVPGQLSFGLITTYQKQPVVLRLSSSDPSGTKAYAIDDQINTTLLWGIGVTRRLELTFAAPITLLQNGVGVSPLTSTEATRITRSAVRDLRAGALIEIVPREGGYLTPGVGLSGRIDLVLPTGDDKVFAGGRGVGAAPSLSFDARLGRLFVAAEAGVRLRKEAEIAGTPIGTQAYEAVGVSVDVLGEENLAVGVEAFALQSFSTSHGLTRDAAGTLVNAGERPMHAPAEWMFDVRSAPALGGDLSLHAAFGTAIPLTDNNVTTPSYRVTGGFRYAPVGRDRDNDGVLDRDDKCQLEPEDRDGFEDEDGCPDPDNDRDGIPDERDRCRDAAEDVDGFEDDDGCPDLDDDKDGVPDVDDKCRNDPEDRDGFQDEDGCPDPDNDGDGIPDAKDMCPLGPEDFDGFRDEDGCPDPDNDADRILDGQDQCPLEAEDYDGFQDEDGCPEPDNDQDGILDGKDKCPLEPETINGVDDEDGCPEKGATDLVSVDKGRIVLQKPVRFAPGKAVVTPEIEAALKMASQKARSLPGAERMIVEAYGDGPQPAAKQEKLATERAEAVRQVLIATGLLSDSLTVAVGDIGAKRPAKAPHVDMTVIVRRKKK